MTRRVLTGILAAVVVVAGCEADGLQENDVNDDRPASRQTNLQPIDELPPLESFPGVLSEGGAPEDAYARPPLAPVTPLEESEIRALLERLDPLPAEPDDKRDFALRPGSQPPPRTGETVAGEFPPLEELAPPQVDPPEGPLEVLRFSPEGEVPLAGQVSVTFDRPMVAVSAHDDVITESLPARLTPEVPGTWRWVGTRTLLFEPGRARLPMATEFAVEIAEGTRAADGSRLEAAVGWAFQTPPLELRRIYPQGAGIRLDPLIYLEFDQRVEPERLLEFIVLEAGGRTLPFHPADAAEIEADESVSRLVSDAEAGRWLVLRAERELPYDSEIRVAVKAGAPSAEGPLLTTGTQQRTFRTHGPFRVTEHRCGWREHCTPADSFSLTFSNQLADAVRIEDHIEVSPPIPGIEVTSWGSTVSVEGWKTGRQTYEITLSPELTDIFGQALTGPRRFTFEVGSAYPRLSASNAVMVTLDPAAPPVLELHSVNYADAAVEIRRVQPRDWTQFVEARNRIHRDKAFRDSLLGEVLFEDRISIKGGIDEIARTGLDLAPYLEEDGTGHLIVIVEAGERMPAAPAREERPERFMSWVQSTRIGLDAFTDAEELLVWTTDLADGSALPGVQVRLGESGQPVTSDDRGLARIELRENGAAWLEARAGGDVAMLPAADHWHGSDWRRRAQNEELRWHVFDDRAMYRPGESVHVKGWVRVIERRKGGDIRLMERPGTLRFEVFDSRNNAIAEGTAELGALGGFDLSFDLPDTPNLGQARVELRIQDHGDLSGDAYQHAFQIQEFRTPEFEVSTIVPEGPFLAGESTTAAVSAAYYAGGPLPGAEVGWQVSATPAYYTPPNRSGWEFGVRPPRWLWWPQPEESVSDSFEGRTDAAGEHHLDIEFSEFETPRPLAVTAQATVMDVNRQAWSSSSDLLVHPATAYVGLRTESYFVERGELLEVELIVTALEGETLPGRPVKVRAERIRGGFWRAGDEEIAEMLECMVTMDTDGRGSCVFEPETGGTWRITATTMDEQGRRNVTRTVRWVSGGPTMPGKERVEIEDVGLIPDRDEYAPGDIARVLVQSPFENAEGLLLINRQGMIEQRRFDIDGTSATLEIPVRSDWLPNVDLQVTLVGSAVREPDEAGAELPPRPAIATDILEIQVSLAERSLAVEVTPKDRRLEPGEDTEISVEVHDHIGRPVAGAELAMVVVDEAILALSGYTLSDPLDSFYGLRPSGTEARHSRRYVELASVEKLLKPELQRIQVTGARMEMAVEDAAMELRMPAAAPPGNDSQPIDIRTDFNPLAAFVPSLTTDAQGRATARFKLPDNLTRYRIMAVAVEGATRFGTGESALTARLPLMVRPAAPRFLNFGDAFEFPVVLQNQTDETITVDIALDAVNLALPGARGYRAEVPPNDRVEVRFPAASENAGTARFQVAAAANGYTDAARGELPVWTPATTEAFATYGVIDEGAIVQPVAAPSDVWPQFGQLEVTASSTAVQSLTDAFIYLYDYPFECTEQAASRLLSIAALRDVLEAFEAEGMPAADEIEKRVSRDIELIASRQNGDGGFGLWRRGEESWPYATMHTAHALVRARDKGYDVPDGLYDSTVRHIRDIERHIPGWYGDRSRRHIAAYALYVRALAGERDPDKARSLLAEVDDLSKLSFESIGWLLTVLTGDEGEEIDALRRFLANRVTETAAGATFASAYGQDDGYLVMHSSRRADGIVLEALIDDQPDSDLIPKLVHALQAHRTRGRWGNTQENAFVLLALDKYFNRYEDQTPDFIARTWLGEDFAGEHRFEGRTTERHHIDIPMAWVARDGGRHDLTLDKDGAGRMYYRVGLRYAPRSLTLEPAAHGFEVQRRYLAVDDDDDVRQRDDGSWEIRAGARVKIELDLVAPARRHHVALVDPLPAGLESINPALAVSEQIEDDEDRPVPLRRWWWGPWYEHQNLRDERTEAFASLLPGGVYTYTYYARATTPGEFVVPPARAEEMYEPETFGRSGTDRVIVVER